MKSLVLWPTSACNLRCRYCYAAGIPAARMEEETAEAAIASMGNAPFKLQLAGGEPLLNLPLTERVIRTARENPNCKAVAIQTNATRIDDETAEFFRRYRVAVGVSLDGSPETNEHQRGRTAEAVNGVKTLAAHGICANLTCVVTAYNAEKLAEIADFAAYLGNIRGIGLDLLRSAGRAACNAGPETRPAAPDALLRGLEALCTRLDALNRLLPPERRMVLREEGKARLQLSGEGACGDYCYAAQGGSYVVLPDGACYPCGSLAGDQRYYMGNVHYTVKPAAIRCETPEDCHSCRYRKYCTGGCPSRGLLAGGFDELDCVLKKFMFQRIIKTGG